MITSRRPKTWQKSKAASSSFSMAEVLKRGAIMSGRTLMPRVRRSCVAGEGLTTQQVTEDEHERKRTRMSGLLHGLRKRWSRESHRPSSRLTLRTRTITRSNADSLRTKLSDLDAEYRRGLSACKSKNIITSHAAFGYLATAYGLNQVAISRVFRRTPSLRRDSLPILQNSRRITM